ncbi:MAG: primosomal protein N' [Thermodesulfobacteriota bacterium]|nr:primosomal protein N' [Thermodesulfobacteriota bacterium]
MTYLEVAVAEPLTYTLTYSTEYPASDLFPGTRLLVPLGNRVVTGYLLGFTSEPAKDIKTRPITDILDPEPLFPENMIAFFRWIADYYQYPIGRVIKGALPAGLSPQMGRRISLTDQGREYVSAIIGTRTDPGYSWLPDFLANGTLSPAAVRKIRRTKGKKILLKWEEEGHVRIRQELTGATAKAGTEVCVCLASTNTEFHPAFDLTVPEQKTLRLIREMSEEAKSGLIPRKDLAGKYSGVRKGLKLLENKGIIKLKKQQVFRDPFGYCPPFFPKPERLTDEQRSALEKINPVVRDKQFQTFLLHGVTGSGKTEVYMRACETALKESRSVLILVPEIALATQLEGHFHSRFGNRLALLHSGLTKGERFDQWMRIARGEASIVIGARSAVFAPVKNPGLIIVDEEHDGAYKQENGLRYQGRDLSVLRASLLNIPVILGSATPSITSYHHASTGKYRMVTLARRIHDRELPKVKIIDLRKVKTVNRRPPLFSPELTTAIKENLSQGNQTLIFLNRRGYANLMLCQDCGHTVQCPNCKITLTLHKGKGELACHHCGHTAPAAILCSNCGSIRLIGVGFGTERIEAELTALFPDAVIARLDRDTAVKRQDYMAILDNVRKRKIDILVGTQMITKGHHFSNVTLVGIIWADAGLGMPDYKAGERTFQLLSQVTGRAGRGEKPGRVIVQTYQPDHYSIITAGDHDYTSLFDRETGIRAPLGFPPFSRLINLCIEGEDKIKVRSSAISLSESARRLAGKKRQISILGPAPAPLSRLRGKYRWQLLLKSANMEALHSICRLLIKEPPPAVRAKAVKLSVDVDPENML